MYALNQIIIYRCMSRSQVRKKSDDISTYIKKQLSTLLKKIQQTPPKKSASLKKIQNIIQTSQITKQQKLQISKSLRKVQSAIHRSNSVHRIKEKLKKSPQNIYQKNLFYQNMILGQKQLNLKAKHRQLEQLNKLQQKTLRKQQSGRQFLNLIQTFEQLRTKRLKYEHEIQNLSIKAQKLQRLIQIKKENQEKYLQSIEANKKYQDKKEKLNSIREEVKSAAKQNRKKMVSLLMKKYSEVQET